MRRTKSNIIDEIAIIMRQERTLFFNVLSKWNG